MFCAFILALGGGIGKSETKPQHCFLLYFFVILFFNKFNEIKKILYEVNEEETIEKKERESVV